MPARRLWALDGARLTMERADMLDGAAPGPVTLIVPSFLASLLVRLPRRTLLLTGDTAHLRGAVEDPAPMSADTDPDPAVASLHRLRAVADEADAEAWVAHDPDGWARFGAPGEIR